MIYGFDTDDRSAATAALIVYAIWRSRDVRRFKITPDVWSKVERFVKAAAKRSRALPDFIESLKPKMACGTIHPKWMEVGIKGMVGIKDSFGGTSFIQRADTREFLTAVIADCDQRQVTKTLYSQTAWVVLLCRDRLERERPIESEIETIIEESL